MHKFSMIARAPHQALQAALAAVLALALHLPALLHLLVAQAHLAAQALAHHLHQAQVLNKKI